MDRVIRLYNPYMPARPIAHLKKHTTPIFFIHLNTEDDRIFTMSTDKSLPCWGQILNKSFSFYLFNLDFINLSTD